MSIFHQNKHINEQQLYNLSFLMALELNTFGSEVISLAKLASLLFEQTLISQWKFSHSSSHPPLFTLNQIHILTQFCFLEHGAFLQVKAKNCKLPCSLTHLHGLAVRLSFVVIQVQMSPFPCSQCGMHSPCQMWLWWLFLLNVSC